MSATIQQIVGQIRTAIFGKDVRESIATGIERCYSDATDVALVQDESPLQSHPNNKIWLKPLGTEVIIPTYAEYFETTKALMTLSEVNLKPMLTGWENGTFSPSTGGLTTGNANTRIRAIDYTDVAPYDKITVTPNDGYELFILWYDDNNACKRSDYWINASSVLTKPSGATKIRVAVRKSPAGTYDLSWVNEFTISAHYPLLDVINAETTVDE